MTALSFPSRIAVDLEGRFHRDPLVGLSTAAWLSVPSVLVLLQFVNPLGLFTCPVKALSGVPCLSCGTTRMLVASAEGNLLEAFTYQPLGFVVPFVLLSYLPLVLWMGDRLPDSPDTHHVRVGALILATAAVMNWSYLVAAGI